MSNFYHDLKDAISRQDLATVTLLTEQYKSCRPKTMGWKEWPKFSTFVDNTVLLDFMAKDKLFNSLWDSNDCYQTFIHDSIFQDWLIQNKLQILAEPRTRNGSHVFLYKLEQDLDANKLDLPFATRIKSALQSVGYVEPKPVNNEMYMQEVADVFAGKKAENGVEVPISDISKFIRGPLVETLEQYEAIWGPIDFDITDHDLPSMDD